MTSGNDERDPLDSWLSQQVHPLPPPPGTFELITRRARRRKLRKLAVTIASARRNSLPRLPDGTGPIAGPCRLF